MEVSRFFKSVVDSDIKPVVICGLNNEIIYMNPAAVKRYAKHGGEALVGRDLFDCHNSDSVKKMKEVIAWFQKSKDNNRVYTYHNDKNGNDYDVYMIALRDENGGLIGYYEKHEDRKRETMPLYDL